MRASFIMVDWKTIQKFRKTHKREEDITIYLRALDVTHPNVFFPVVVILLLFLSFSKCKFQVFQVPIFKFVWIQFFDQRPRSLIFGGERDKWVRRSSGRWIKWDLKRKSSNYYPNLLLFLSGYYMFDNLILGFLAKKKSSSKIDCQRSKSGRFVRHQTDVQCQIDFQSFNNRQFSSHVLEKPNIRPSSKFHPELGLGSELSEYKKVPSI